MLAGRMVGTMVLSATLVGSTASVLAPADLLAGPSVPVISPALQAGPLPDARRVSSAALSVVADASRVAPRRDAPAEPAVATRAKVPAGCDRLVSSLVKSTAAARLGRCIT